LIIAKRPRRYERATARARPHASERCVEKRAPAALETAASAASPSLAPTVCSATECCWDRSPAKIVMSHMNAASPRQSLVKGERLTRYELAAVMGLGRRRWRPQRKAAVWRSGRGYGRRPRAPRALDRHKACTQSAVISDRSAHTVRFGSTNPTIGSHCWPPRVRRRPLSEIALWITGSPASWRVSQTSECNDLLTATRGVYMIAPQRQPGKFNREGRTVTVARGAQLRGEAGRVRTSRVVRGMAANR
jgi:hypothetical protein